MAKGNKRLYDLPMVHAPDCLLPQFMIDYFRAAGGDNFSAGVRMGYEALRRERDEDHAEEPTPSGWIGPALSKESKARLVELAKNARKGTK